MPTRIVAGKRVEFLPGGRVADLRDPSGVARPVVVRGGSVYQMPGDGTYLVSEGSGNTKLTLPPPDRNASDIRVHNATGGTVTLYPLGATLEGSRGGYTLAGNDVQVRAVDARTWRVVLDEAAPVAPTPGLACSFLRVNGGSATLTADNTKLYNVALDDSTPRTLTLPACSAHGQRVHIYAQNYPAGGHTVASAGGDTFARGGGATLTLGGPASLMLPMSTLIGIVLQSDGVSKWYTLGVTMI